MTCTAQSGRIAVGVVVVFGEGSAPAVRCGDVPKRGNGIDALRSAGFAPRIESGFLCAIDQVPSSGCATGSDFDGSYWRYFKVGAKGQWEYATVGAGERLGAADGCAIEGWVWSSSKGLAAPPVAPSSVVCRHTVASTAPPAPGTTQRPAGGPGAGGATGTAPRGPAAGESGGVAASRAGIAGANNADVGRSPRTEDGSKTPAGSDTETAAPTPGDPYETSLPAGVTPPTGAEAPTGTGSGSGSTGVDRADDGPAGRSGERAALPEGTGGTRDQRGAGSGGSGSPAGLLAVVVLLAVIGGGAVVVRRR